MPAITATAARLNLIYAAVRGRPIMHRMVVRGSPGTSIKPLGPQPGYLAECEIRYTPGVR